MGTFTATAFLTLGAGRTSFACSCVGERPPAEAAALADVVFYGAPTRITRANEWFLAARLPPLYAFDRLIAGRAFRDCLAAEFEDRFWDTATFRVIETWKGAHVAEAIARAPPPTPGGGSCGIAWTSGEDWVVYAWHTGLTANGVPVYETHSCSRTRKGPHAAQERKALRSAFGNEGLAEGGVEQNDEPVNAREE